MYRIDENHCATADSAASRVAAPGPLPDIGLLGLNLVSASAAATMDWLCERLDAALPTRVAFLNAHCANVAAKDGDYREAISSADAVLPDGSGVELAVRMRGRSLAANLNGTDLIPALLRPVVGQLRAILIRQFVAGAQDDPEPHVSRVARARAEDPNVRPAEADRLLRMAERAEPTGSAPREGRPG